MAARRANVAEMGLFGDHGPISNGTPGPAVATSPSAPRAIPGLNPQALLLRMIVRAALLEYAPDIPYASNDDRSKAAAAAATDADEVGDNAAGLAADARLLKRYGANGSSNHALTEDEEDEAAALPQTEDPEEQCEQMEQFLEAFAPTDVALEQHAILEVLNLRRARLRASLRVRGEEASPKKKKAGTTKQTARATRRAELAASVCEAHIRVLDELIAHAKDE